MAAKGDNRDRPATARAKPRSSSAAMAPAHAASAQLARPITQADSWGSLRSLTPARLVRTLTWSSTRLNRSKALK